MTLVIGVETLERVVANPKRKKHLGRQLPQVTFLHGLQAKGSHCPLARGSRSLVLVQKVKVNL